MPVKEATMDWWQFLIIVALLLWIIRRLPPRLAQEVFIQRLFNQLNRIESVVSGVSEEEIRQKWLDYQLTRIAVNKGAPWSERIRG
jgi:hypothetical protein